MRQRVAVRGYHVESMGKFSESIHRTIDSQVAEGHLRSEFLLQLLNTLSPQNKPQENTFLLPRATGVFVLPAPWLQCSCIIRLCEAYTWPDDRTKRDRADRFVGFY